MHRQEDATEGLAMAQLCDAHTDRLVVGDGRPCSGSLHWLGASSPSLSPRLLTPVWRSCLANITPVNLGR